VDYSFRFSSIGSSCSTATYDSAQWVGFDGWGGSGDVLQGGVEANCGNSDYAWYEWFLTPKTILSSPTVAAGDFVYAETIYDTATPHGNFYIWNETTGVATAVLLIPLRA